MSEATALRALGILRGEPLVRLMSRLRDGDPALEEDLRSMERAAAMVALTAPPTDPPEDLKRRVLSRVGADSYYFLRERESDWEPASVPGAYVRRLHIDSRAGRETRLVRLMPSAGSDALAALAGLDFYVVSGEIQVEGSRLEIGDFFHGAGAQPLGRTDLGCVLYTLSAPVSGRAKVPIRTVVRAVEGNWTELAPGLLAKKLAESPDRGLELKLIRMEAGATWPAHHHEGAEEIFLLRGDLRCLGQTLRAGDYHRAGGGTDHVDAPSSAGCKLIMATHLVTASDG